LSGGDATLGLVEGDVDAFRCAVEAGRLEGLAVADADGVWSGFADGQGEVGTYPVDVVVADEEAAAVETRVVLSHSDIDYVFFDVGGDYEEWFFFTADVESFALSDGEEVGAGVGAYYFAVGRLIADGDRGVFDGWSV
jgi:hypothetical protein